MPLCGTWVFVFDGVAEQAAGLDDHARVKVGSEYKSQRDLTAPRRLY